MIFSRRRTKCFSVFFVSITTQLKSENLEENPVVDPLILSSESLTFLKEISESVSS